MTNGNVVVKIELEKKRHCFSAIQFCKRTTPLYPKLRLGGGGDFTFCIKSFCEIQNVILRILSPQVKLHVAIAFFYREHVLI